MSPLAALMKSKAQELKLRGTNVIYLRERRPNTTNSDYLMKTSDIVTDLQNVDWLLSIKQFFTNV